MLGVIGAGNMGGALIRGMIFAGADAKQFAAYDLSRERLEELAELGVFAADSCEKLIEMSDVVMIAVKPKHCAALLEEIAPMLEGKNVLSIVTGWSMEELKEAIPKASGIVRMMPNTPAAVGKGVLALAVNHSMEEAAFEELKSLLSYCGRVEMVDESLFDAVTSVSGSGPAYVYLFIEALADAGVLQGLSRPQAYSLAAQTVLGAAEMVLKTGQHPGKLKDDVCSPAGTTIEAVYALEKGGLRGTVMDGVQACADKLKKMRGGKA